MKPPTAMLMPLSTWDIASSMGTTLFLGTFRSFARERCRGPGLRSGAARARQSPGYTLLTEEYHSPRATPAPRHPDGAGGAATLAVSSCGHCIRIVDASVTDLCAVRVLYTSRGAWSEGRVRCPLSRILPRSVSSVDRA